jgi:hypothetical protein
VKPKNIILADEDVNGPAIDLARRIWNIEIVRVVDVGLAHTDDQIIFDYAIEHGYVLVSGNIKHHRQVLPVCRDRQRSSGSHTHQERAPHEQLHHR